MASESGDQPSRLFQEALYDSLAGDRRLVRDADPLRILARIVDTATRAARAAGVNPRTLEALEGLARIGAGTDLADATRLAESLYETPGRLSEAIYFARCLGRDAAGSGALFDARAYVEAAFVPDTLPELQTDRQAVLDASTLAVLWREPARLAWMLTTVGIWRRDYTVRYVKAHATYHAVTSEVSERVDEVEAQAAALERLNRLGRLGPPVATAALTEFRRLQRLFPCPVLPTALDAGLANITHCAVCDMRLGDRVGRGDSFRTLRAVERGLATQQGRLARRVVARLLARPQTDGEAKVRRFIEIVQASDLAGLALVLDDALIEFVRELLESPSGEIDVLSQIADAFPEVTPANLNAAVAEFRRLVEAGFTLGRGRVVLRQSRA